MSEPRLQVDKYPDLKRKVLVLTEVGYSHVLARFESDMCAALFLDTANSLIKRVYEMGRKAGLREAGHVVGD